MVKPIRFAVIDDEPPAIEVTTLLMEQFSDFECIATWTDPSKALKEISIYSPQLLFLDVEMPTMSGLEFLSQLAQPPITILVTAYSEYAVDAFSFGVREYILKPMSAQRLALALSNVKQLLVEQNTNQIAHQSLVFKDGYEQRFIDPRKIVRIHAEGNFSNFVLEDGSEHLISENLRLLSQRLLGFGFIRIHKSILLNQQYIRAMKTSYVTLTDGSKQPVGRTYQSNVKSLF